MSRSPTPRIARYLVLHETRGWVIELDGSSFGPYRSQKAAVKAAIDAALLSVQLRYEATVHVRSLDGKERSVWQSRNQSPPR